MTEPVKILCLQGDEMRPYLGDLARLRIEVFRDFPYLYLGTVEYEQEYLAQFSKAPDSLLVLALDGERVVGASTGLPLCQGDEVFREAFSEEEIATTYYCAESVLLPEYRGRGIGHRFFDRREDHARALGCQHITFCSVIRPEDHPLKPADYRSNDEFWRKRGYVPDEGREVKLSWQDVDHDAETLKALAFWSKEMTPGLLG
jgi:GNAT superfamily N-acetyltransferase